MKKILTILVAIGMIFASGSFMSASASAPIDWTKVPDETLPIPV